MNNATRTKHVAALFVYSEWIANIGPRVVVGNIVPGSGKESKLYNQ